MRELTWHGVEDGSVESCRIDADDATVRVRSTIDGAFGTLTYDLRADAGWRFRSVHVMLAGRAVDVTRRGGHWYVDGLVRRDLDAALEADLSATPLSNTLPIRRLGLGIGQAADITTAYITVPGLTVTPDPQRYTRVSRLEYLYESRDSSFSATITVDDGGLVVDYPGLFQRGGRLRDTPDDSDAR